MKKTPLILILTMLLIVPNITAISKSDIHVYWSFDTEFLSGTSAIDSAGNYNLTMSAEGDAGAVNGKLGTAYLTDGTNAKEGTADKLVISNRNTGSINFWFNLSVSQDTWYFMDYLRDNDGLLVGLDSTTEGWRWRLGDDDDLQGGLDQRGLYDGDWHMITFVYNVTHGIFYVDGAVVSSNSGQTRAVTNAAGTLAFNGLSQGEGSDLGAPALLDEFSWWLILLSPAEVTELYNSGAAFNPFTSTTPVLTSSYPTEGLAYNDYNGWINITSDINVSTCWSNNTDWVLQSVIGNNCTFFNSGYGALAGGTHSLNITANSTEAGLNGSKLVTFTIDTVYPTITLNETNGFDYNNFSRVVQYKEPLLPIWITIKDDRDLSAFGINITNSVTNEIMFNYTNETLSGLAYQYNITLNATNWAKNVAYNIEISVADSHNQLVKSYDIPLDKPLYQVTQPSIKELNFNTIEKNNIAIYTNDDAKLTAIRFKDKYEIEAEYYKDIPIKTYYVASDKKIKYKPNSEWKGHFVIGNSKGGNYVDFENEEGNVKVTKINNYLYKVEVTTSADSIRFHSIGGLNVLTQTFTWYKGNYSLIQAPEPVFFGETSTLSLNVTKDANIQDISARLYWNNTLQVLPTKTTTSNYITFENAILSQDASQDFNISYKWIVNVTQGNNNITFFNTTTTNQTFYNWGIDDCGTFTEPALTFYTRDEVINSLIETNTTFSFTYYISGDSTNTRTYSIADNDNHTFNFCKSSSTIDLIGDMSHITTKVGYGTRTFNRYDIEYTGTFTGYLLEDTATTDSITFILVDTASDPVEGALMNIFRNINGTDILVFQGESDFAGQIQTFLDTLFVYDFTINATEQGFPLKEFSLQPTSSPVTITLTKEESSFYDNAYTGIKFRFRHNGNVVGSLPNIFNVTNEFTNLSFELAGSGLEEIGMNFSNHNYVCVPSNCVATFSSSTGGIVTVSIKMNESGNLNTAFYFKRIDGARIYINDGIIKVVPFIFRATNSFIQLVGDIKANFSPNTITIFVAILEVCAVGIGTALGLYGILLILPVVGVNIILSLEEIALINPFVGIIISIFGIGLYIMSQMRTQ